MRFSKIKNVFLLALLLVNGFLLIIVIPQSMETKQTAKATAAELETLFSRRGISLNYDVVDGDMGLYELELTGGIEAEQNAASLLLGSTMLMGDESSMVSNVYAGQRGTAEFHKSGAFTVTITEASASDPNLSSAGAQLLEGLGFQPYGEVELTRLSAGRYAVFAVQTIENAPVYSSGVTLEYDNYCLTSINGVWYTTYTGQKGKSKCVTASTALVSFLASQDELGWLCTSVEEVKQGYVEEATPSLGAARLIPVWKIRTDTGEFYVNGLTKEVTAA